MAKKEETVRYSLEVPKEMAAELEDLARAIRGSKADVFRRSIELLKVALQAKREGKRFGVTDADGMLSLEIVGI